MSVIEQIRETFRDIPIGSVFTTSEIKHMVNARFGTNEGSVIPSDCCYNMTNKGIKGNAFESFNIFIQIKYGVYKYVGENYNGHFPQTNTTEEGYINKNNQKNCGRACKSDNHYNQWFFDMECLDCGHKYLANGSDIWLRKCPNCQVKSSVSKRKTSRNVSEGLRYKVLKRDHFKCCACGASPAKDPSVELHVDHIIPWSKGGETELENLQTLCSKCNLGKSDSL